MNTAERYFDRCPDIVFSFIKDLVGNHHSSLTVENYFSDICIFLRFLMVRREVVPRSTLSDKAAFDALDVKSVTLEQICSVELEDLEEYKYYLFGVREIPHKSEKKSKENAAKEVFEQLQAATGENPKPQLSQAGTNSGLEPRSVRRKISSVHSFYKYLMKHGKIESDPFTLLSSIRVDDQIPKYYSEPEAIALLQSAKGLNEKRDRCILRLMLVCGLREAEVSGMHLDQIGYPDEDGGVIIRIHGKGNKYREVYLEANSKKDLDAYLEVREKDYAPLPDYVEYVFLSRQHKRISNDAIQLLVSRAEKQAGIKQLSPHKLRHTAASTLLNNGHDLSEIQEALGHKSISTTQQYAHLSKLRKKKIFDSPLGKV